MDALCKSLFQPLDLNSPAVIHGRTFETVALEKFTEKTAKQVKRCGLFVNPDFPCLAASPDSLIEGEKSLIEVTSTQFGISNPTKMYGDFQVKCPFSIKDKMIDETCGLGYLELRNGQWQLKRNHQYFYQVQGQLAIAQQDLCYFVVYTHEDCCVLTIPYEPDFFQEMISPLFKFYYEIYLPFLVKQLCH